MLMVLWRSYSLSFEDLQVHSKVAVVISVLEICDSYMSPGPEVGYIEAAIISGVSKVVQSSPEELPPTRWRRA